MCKEPDEEVVLSVSAIRRYFDSDGELEELDTALDSAQGPVFTGEKEETTILITIRR